MKDDNPARTQSRVTNLAIVERLHKLLDAEAWALVHAPAGRQLLRTGDRVSALPLIVTGTLDAVVHQLSDEGNQVVPVSWGEGEIAMLSHLFFGDPISFDLVAADDASIRWIPIGEVERCLIDQQDILVLLVRFLVQRLREVQFRERVWLERGVHERVCASLARIASAMPAGPDGAIVVGATHESLASRCAVSRPRLSKELKRLEVEGRLKLGRGTIEIIDHAWFKTAHW